MPKVLAYLLKHLKHLRILDVKNLSEGVAAYRYCQIVNSAAVFWVKVILVLNTILRYGHLNFFFFGQEKHPLEWLLDIPDLNIKIGKNTQDIPHKA